MHKNIKIKLYPTVKQKQILNNHFNGYRFSYNLCLEYKSIMWKYYKINVSGYDMQKELLQIRKDTSWLSSCKAECISVAPLNVEKAYRGFFKGMGFPKFKSRKGNQSFYACQNMSLKDGYLKFYGSYVKYKSSVYHSQLIESNDIKNVTFKIDSCGDYCASCLIEIPNSKQLAKNNNSIGIDLGLSHLVVTSEGVKYENNKYLLNTHSKISKLQKSFSRTKKGSNNRNKLRIKISRLHRKVFRQREHYYHQITNELIRDNQTIVIETLKVTNMLKNQKLSRGISDASWGMLTRQLEYKSNWYGRDLIKIGTFYPSTKTCSSCGNIKDMPLGEHVYNCECGLSLDRDINAAINIKNSGLKIPGVSVEGVGYEPVEAESKCFIIKQL